MIPSALGAQQLRNADWKGWSASWVSHVQALKPAKPVSFKVLGARAPALREWVLLRLTGERPAGIPSLTTVWASLSETCERSKGQLATRREAAAPTTGPLLQSWSRSRRTPAPRSPRSEGTPEDVHAVVYLWLNVQGRYLRQCLLAQALHMAARRPNLLMLAEGQTPAGPEDPAFQDYARHVVLPAQGKTGAGLEVYFRAGTTTWASLLWSTEDANALLMEVLTPWGWHHVLAAHAPRISIGVEPYVRWWATI